MGSVIIIIINVVNNGIKLLKVGLNGLLHYESSINFQNFPTIYFHTIKHIYIDLLIDILGHSFILPIIV